MSLTISLQSALASLNATQGAMQVVSNNVANATTEGFTKKTVATQTQIVAGRASGVRLTDIQRVVDQNLLRQIREQLAKVEDLSVRSDYYGRIQDLFGSPGSNSDVSHLLTEFGVAIESLATTPESAPGKYDTIAQAVQFTDRLNLLSSEIQQMRREVDRNISDAVSLVNTKLTTINDLNNQISLAFGQQQSAADLEDARDKVMAELSELIEIQTFDRSNGHVVVFTSSGRPLIDNGVVNLSHTAVAQFDASISYPGNVSGITYGAGSIDITTEIANGRLAGLIEMRDQRLVELQEEYDRITETMTSGINAAHNAGTSFPPPTTLTSTRGFATGDDPGMSGTFRVSILDSS
ncbi:MAG: flagellar hook-associated protein FlgK, partial [Alphaproteobacteria bacterium]